MTHPSLTAAVAQVTPTIVAVADQLWDFAELAYTEVRSSALLKQVLQEHGFTITHAKVGALETAFVAEYGTGAPIIGILAEYDALPGLGNTADPAPTPRPDGQTNGHGCGHNLIGAGALGAASPCKRCCTPSSCPAPYASMERLPKKVAWARC